MTKMSTCRTVPKVTKEEIILKKVDVEKNKEYIVEILDNGFEGEGIAKINNFTVFIPGAIKGEIIRILIVKVLSSYAFGKIMEIIEKSKYREKPDCETYKRCGGCDLRHVCYEETLNMKQNAVQSLVNKTLKNKIEVLPTVAMGNPYNYRNKLQFPVGINRDGKAYIGVFANRTHEIIPIKNCMIQNEKSTKIAESVIEWANMYNISVYNEKTNEGILRHIVIKNGFQTGEYMVVIVINENKLPHSQEFVDILLSKYKEIKSIFININKKNTNVILGNENRLLYGNEFILDKLGDYNFKISPLSFYQVNPVQAECLYNIAVEEAEISKEDIVFDLYCGIGTISLFMSKYAKKVYGVEIIEQAIEMAKENAIINNIDNAEFIAGDTKIVLDDLINTKKIIPDVVMVDPPRKGLDEKSINNILEITPKKLVYISCNPASLVRDLALLEEKYEIKSIQPVDMFPFTHHVECVACLELK